MALITGKVKALKADDSIFGLRRPPQINVHVYMHSLKFGERFLAVSRRYPGIIVFEKGVGPKELEFWEMDLTMQRKPFLN